MRLARALGGVVLASAFALIASCVAHEETTPQGYVIAPSVPADGGPWLDASLGDANASDANLRVKLLR